MSKVIFNLRVWNFQRNLSVLNKEKNIFSNISYVSGEKNEEDIKKIKKFFKEVMIFLNQFDEIKKDLKIKLVIDMSCKPDIFLYRPENHELRISINNNYINVKEILNHEFFHALDYYNGKNEEAFSEMHKNIDKKIYINVKNKIEKNIIKFFNYILKGKKIENKTNILNFDFNILKNSLTTLLLSSPKKNINSEEVEMLTISNLRVFNKFLDAMNILKGQYYLCNDKNSGKPLVFDLNEYLINKNRLFKEFDSLYDEIEHFSKRFSYICKRYNISNKNINSNLIKIINEETLKDFNVFLSNGISTFDNLFDYYTDVNLDDVRNIYYTPTLKILTEKPNSLLLEKIANSKNNKFYLFAASEKISYCGQKNEGNLLNTFVKLSLNKEHKIKFSKQPTSEDYEQLSEDAEQAFVRFIKKKNEYIDYDPVLNIKNKKQKSITPKTNAPVVFSNPNKNANTPKRDSVIQNIIKKQQLQKSTVQNQNIEVERNKKPKI
ncbi:TPA: hypothetical protein NV714_001677 [Escherichia coli]|nr:hypothetical protein [Escherichia coli]